MDSGKRGMTEDLKTTNYMWLISKGEKILKEMKKMRVTGNFSFFHNVFCKDFPRVWSKYDFFVQN